MVIRMEEISVFIRSIFNIYIIYSLYYIILTKIMKKDLYKYTFGVSTGDLWSNTIFFAIAFIVFFFAFAFAYGVPEGINEVTEYYVNVSGLTSMIILAFGGVVTKKVYYCLNIMVKKLLPNCKLHYISENNRMWAFLIVSMIYCLITLTDERGEKISYMALSVIIGRMFWIDNKKNSLKKFFRSFFDIPHLLGVFYVLFIYDAVIFYIKESSDMSDDYAKKYIYSAVTGFITYIIFCTIKCRKKIMNNIIKKIEREEKKEKNRK